MPSNITFEINVAAPIDSVWNTFNEPNEILKWDKSEDWYTTSASNDLTVGGKLLQHMESKNGDTGFDVVATYTKIEHNKLIEFRMDDGRMFDRIVKVEFFETFEGVKMRQTFQAESAIPLNQQLSEWQSVLNRFAQYVESLNK